MEQHICFDVRGKHLTEARHWSAPEVFGPRAHFSVAAPTAALVVRDVKRRDEGVYRCRVDFRNTQTTSFRYNLTVVVPPEKPVVVDRWGRVINTTTLGPHEEGDDVLLTCRVLGGRPEPQVRWLVNGVLVDEEYEHNTGDVIENRLLWPQISRGDYAAVFTCQAANSLLVPPKEVSLVLDMFLKPLTVEINKPTETGDNGVLTAERRYEVTCESAGSRPPAVITWYKGKRQLKRITEELRDNMTVSVMSFVPTLDDDGKAIICKAENPNVTLLYLETSWTISVVYPPVVWLRLGSSLAASDIKEGDDVYFECHVRANPPARKLSWLHDDRPLAHNATARVFHSNQSLVLQKVTRHSSGRYACSALNAEGETVSNELHFRVKYAPSCRAGGVSVVGAARGESVVIVCEVDADPPAAVFKWKFNNSGETIDVAADRYTSNGSASSLKYTPVADLDYGTLSCSASNEVGTQVAPCVFQMVAAGKPHAPRNCTLWNQTSDSVEVSCVPGFDGGLPQRFLLEVYSGKEKYPRFNLSSEEPTWTVRGLEWDVRFRLAAVAVNSKGRSPPARLADVLFRDPEKRTASEAPLGVGGLVGAMAAGLGAICALVAGACAASLRRRRRAPHGKPPPAPLVQRDVPKVPEHDDAEPDLIPNNYCEATNAPSVAVSSPGRTAPAPLTTPACNGPGASWTWSSRPRDLGVGAEAPRALSIGRSASATLRAAADLNVDAIKEKLLDHRIPESCV
ncbi:nephrin-like [Hyposmocoma kahamanoa]|uniref:nephrin-like n=1 Tax=Hyposmocoma kahamanoa TaxID=1477025 RepID=UPI000E6D90E7|nr:nephrin-like [Hyposmocoma kahamanoa]